MFSADALTYKINIVTLILDTLTADIGLSLHFY
jgi:hypothetical protein